MLFTVEKCSQTVTKRGKVFRTEGTAQQEGNIAAIEDSYKYLVIPKVNGKHEEVDTKLATSPEESAEWEEQNPGN